MPERRTVSLLLLTGLLAACTSAAPAPTPTHPARPEPTAGKPLHDGSIVFTGHQPGPYSYLPYAALSAATPVGSTHSTGLTRTSGRIGSVAASADGSRIAYTAETYRHNDHWYVAADHVHVVNADGSDDRTVYRCPSAACSGLEWSPVGDRLLINGSVVLDAQGHLTKFCDGECDDAYPISEATWSPDGQRIAFATAVRLQLQGGSATVSAIAVADADGTNARLLTNQQCSVDDQSQCTYDGAPVWSPGGDEIAFTRLDPAWLRLDGSMGLNPAGPTGVFVVRADGTGVTELHACGKNCRISTIRWSPDGARVAFVTSQMSFSHDTATSTVGVADATDHTSDVIRVQTHVSLANDSSYIPAISWAPSGTSLAMVAQRLGHPSSLYVVRVRHHIQLASPTLLRADAYQPLTWLPRT